MLINHVDSDVILVGPLYSGNHLAVGFGDRCLWVTHLVQIINDVITSRMKMISMMHFPVSGEVHFSSSSFNANLDCSAIGLWVIGCTSGSNTGLANSGSSSSVTMAISLCPVYARALVTIVHSVVFTIAVEASNC